LPLPLPLPLETVASGDCEWCSGVRQIFGFRTASGYGFVWRVKTDESAPGPNLFSMNVGPNFERASAPRALAAENSAYNLNLVPGPNGFVATTCSWESKPEWIQLNGDLDVVQGVNFGAPDATCGSLAPSVLWTGEVYLTSYRDSRGLVVAALDERGAVVGEEVLSDQGGLSRWEPIRFAKNGDRVLFAFVADRAWYAVFDLRGTLLSEVQPIGEEYSDPVNLAIAPNRDGWWVVTTVGADIRLTKISQDGLSSPEQDLLDLGRAYYMSLDFTPSAYGGFLLVATLDTAGQYGCLYNVIVRIDDEGELGCYEEIHQSEVASWPIAVVDDPLRDLMVENLDEHTLIVREYGNLN
jgi:hypothetical protein